MIKIANYPTPEGRQPLQPILSISRIFCTDSDRGSSGVAFLFFQIFVGAVLLINSSSTMARQLLKNPSFEGSSIRGIAQGWHDNSGWADVDIEYQQDEDAVAGKSQAIHCREVRSGAVQLVQPAIHLVKGQTYEVGIWAKGRTNGPLELLLRQQGTPYETYARSSFHITEHWTYYKFVATAGVDVPSAYFMVRLTSVGDVWLDEASLNQIKPVEKEPSHNKKNLIANGSFEVGVDRWAVKVRESGGYRYQMPVEYRDIRPLIVSGSVPHGNQAMYIHVPEHGRAIITTKLREPLAGHHYTISLWLKADTSDTKVSLNLSTGFGDKVNRGKTVKVTRNWKRYSFSVVLFNTQYHLVLDTSKSGGLFIDDVEIVSDGTDRFTYSHPVEVGFSRSGRAPLFYTGDKIKLEFCVASYQSDDEPFVVHISSTDLNGNEVAMFEYKFNAPTAECRVFSHPQQHTGYFQINATVTNSKGQLDQATIAIGILSRNSGLQKLESPFGGHATFAPENLRAAKMLGVSWLRMHPPFGTKWFVIEPKRKQFNFIDEPIIFAKKQGFNILGTLHGTPRWASSAPVEVTSEQLEGYPAYPPKNIPDWERYVEATVSRYRGIINDWEVWNEPDSSGLKLNGIITNLRKPGIYIDLVRAAYKAAKKINPNIKLIAGVGARKPPVVWVEELVNRGILNYIDGLSFHYYADSRPTDDLYVRGRLRVKEMREVIQKAEPKKMIPIWETESGYNIDVCGVDIPIDTKSYCITPEQSVALVVRDYIEWISSNVDHCFIYNMFFPDRTDRHNWSAFFDWDRSPTPLAIGYAVLSRMLSGMKYVDSIERLNGGEGANFVSQNTRLRVLWRTEYELNKEGRELIVVDPNAREVQVIDSMGNVISRNKHKQKISIPVSVAPVYVMELY